MEKTREEMERRAKKDSGGARRTEKISIKVLNE